MLETMESISLSIQDIFHVKRKAYENTEIFKGTNWFSITHELAVYTLSKEKEIRKCFGYGLCADELFLQTIVMNSRFAII